jgi:hypothetical protein
MIIWRSGGPLSVSDFLLGVLLTLVLQQVLELWRYRRSSFCSKCGRVMDRHAPACQCGNSHFLRPWR